MPRHRFDPVALVFGAVFVAAGAIVLAGGELIDEGRALVPAGLIALGVALLVHVGRRASPSTPAGAVADHAPPVASDRDLDALFAPIDDALADWDRAHPPSEVDITQTDAPPTDPTEVDAPSTDAPPTDPTEVDVTEVVDPTERYPRREPE
ncbi:MAG: hypothetical protein ACRDZ0_15445 [Acidimicrobiales bacterium]